MAVALRGMAPLLVVEDLQASLAFYRDVLDFEVISTSGDDYPPGWALLARGGTELMLNGAHGPGALAPRDPARAAAHGDTALYFGCADLDGAWQHLRGHGIELAEPMLTDYGFRSLALTDPDGYTLVLHWPDSPEAKQDWEARYGTESLRTPG